MPATCLGKHLAFREGTPPFWMTVLALGNPGDWLVGRAAVGEQALRLGVDLIDGLLQVQRLAERLPDVLVDAQVDLAAVSFRVEEVNAVGALKKTMPCPASSSVTVRPITRS